MGQKKFLSMILILSMIFSLCITTQVTWGVILAPTISADKSALYIGEEDGQTVVITLENDTFSEPAAYCSVEVNGSFSSTSGSYNSTLNTTFTITVNNPLSAGDVVTIYFKKEGLTSGLQDTNILTLIAQPARPLSFGGDDLGRVDLNNWFEHYFTSEGGIGTKTYVQTSGILPDGLSLSTGGKLSGITAKSGEYTFEITVFDSDVPSSTSSGIYKLLVNEKSDYEVSDHTIIGYTGPGGAISIPSEVNGVAITAIGYDAFGGNSSLTSVVIPSSVTLIDSNAFHGCVNLSEVTIPSSVTSIGSSAFATCSNLSELTIPSGVKYIDAYAFQGCASLKELTVPDSVEYIGEYAFSLCGSLTTVVLPAHIPEIPDYGFYSCGALESITIPGEIQRIGDSAFQWCTKLKTVELPENLMAIGDSAFRECRDLEVIIIPSYVAEIGASAFKMESGGSDLIAAIFTGDAPVLGESVFYNPTSGFKIYYPENKSGYTNPWNGFETVAYDTSGDYSVTYDANGGDGDLPSQIVRLMLGDCVTVEGSGNLSVVNGTFTGWNTAKDGTGVDYAAGDTIVILGESVTLYAQWDRRYTIEVDDTIENGSVEVGIYLAAEKNLISVKTSPDEGYCLKEGSLVYNDGTKNYPIDMEGFNEYEDPDDTSGTKYYMFVMPPANITITAQFESTSADDGDDGDSPTNTGTGKTVEPNPTEDSSTNVAVTALQIQEALNTALQAGGLGQVAIEVNAPDGANAIEATLPREAMASVADSGAKALTLSTPIATLTFDRDALQSISEKAEADIKITVSKVDSETLSDAAKAVVGDHPVYDFSVISGDEVISEFNGEVTVSMPYTLQAGENAESVVIYYINAEGIPEVVNNCKYDPETGTVTFTTTHFSMYAVGYNAVTFGDVPADASYCDAVNFVAARGIATGTGDGNFSPEAGITRGQFIVMMMNAYGIEADTIEPDDTVSGGIEADNFADAGSTYYTNYLSAAKRLGIANGIGDNLYAPENALTRQEMVQLLYNALTVLDALPAEEQSKALTTYADADQIASWAEAAMTRFVNANAFTGNGGKLTPEETATRAEMAQILYNLLMK
jgi:hypothetical protein